MTSTDLEKLTYKQLRESVLEMLLDFTVAKQNIKESAERIISQAKQIGTYAKEDHLSKEERKELLYYFKLAEKVHQYQIQTKWIKEFRELTDK